MSVIALIDDSDKYSKSRLRSLELIFGDQLISLSSETSVSELNRLIQCSSDEWIALIHQQTLCLQKWIFPTDQKYALIGASIETALGPRIGYELLRSESQTIDQVFRRTPLSNLKVNGSRYASVDIPNDNAFLINKKIFIELGCFDPKLNLRDAFSDLAIRVLEQGYSCGVDTQYSVKCSSGYSETLLVDEKAFASQRTQQQWEKIIHGAARRVPRLAIDLVIVGDGRHTKNILESAGYPIERTYWAADDRPPSDSTMIATQKSPNGLLRQLLESRRDRAVAIIDSSMPSVDGWLLHLLEESEERADIAITVLGDSGTAGPVTICDTHGSLIRLHRLPGLQVINIEGDTNDYLARLSGQLSAYGLGIRATRDTINRTTKLTQRLFIEVNPSEKNYTNQKISVVLLLSSDHDSSFFTTGKLRACTREPYELLLIIPSVAKKMISYFKADPAVKVYIEEGDIAQGARLGEALKDVTGDFIALMRDDIVVPEGWAETLTEAMARVPKAGLVLPRMSNGVGAHMTEDDKFANTAEFRLASQRRKIKYSRQSTKVTTFSIPVLMMRKEVLQVVGGFDHKLLLNEYGLLDYAIRVQACGFEIIVAEDALVHKINPDLLTVRREATMTSQQQLKYFIKKWQVGRDDSSKIRVMNLIKDELSIALRYVSLTSEVQNQKPINSIKSDDLRLQYLLGFGDTSADFEKSMKDVEVFIEAFTIDDPVTLVLVCHEKDLAEITSRIEKIIIDKKIKDEQSLDIAIVNIDEQSSWILHLPDGPRVIYGETLMLDKVEHCDRRSVRKLRSHADLALGKSGQHALSS